MGVAPQELRHQNCMIFCHLDCFGQTPLKMDRKVGFRAIIGGQRNDCVGYSTSAIYADQFASRGFKDLKSGLDAEIIFSGT